MQQAGESDESIELHARVTVVAGLRRRTRARLIHGLAGIPEGRIDGVSGEIEAHGIRLDLSSEALSMLDLRDPVDIVVRAADLPGASPRASLVGAQRDQIEAEREGLVARLAAAETLGVEAGVERDRADATLEKLRSATGDDAPERLLAEADEQLSEAQSAVEAAEWALAEAQGVGPPLPDSGVMGRAVAAEIRADRVAGLTQRRDEIRRRLLPLSDSDPTGLAGALEAASGPGAAASDREVAAAGRLADEWDELGVQLSEIDARVPRSGEGDEPQAGTPALPGVDLAAVAEARSRLESATRGLEELRSTLNSRAAKTVLVIDELERAHRAVLRAQERSEAHFAKRRSSRVLGEARQAEQQVLDRLGFATYAEFVMSSTGRRSSADQAALDVARNAAAAAEAALDALIGPTSPGADGSSTATPSADAGEHEEGGRQALDRLLDRRVQLLEETEALLGSEPGTDPSHDLRVFAGAPAALARLRAELSQIGMSIDEADFRPDTLVALGRVWLAENSAAAPVRDELLHELGEVEEELRAEEEAPEPSAATEVPPDAPVELDESSDSDEVKAARAALTGARELAERAQALHASLHEAAERGGGDLLAELERRLEAATSAYAASAAEVRTIEIEIESADRRLAALLVEERAATDNMPPTSLSDERFDEIEWYLLARLAGQRQVSLAGSLPIVLDDPFRELSGPESVRLAGGIARMAEAVQLILFTDNRDLVEWADGLGSDNATVVSMA